MTNAPAESPCPFCFPALDRIAFEVRLVRALWDAFPVNPGHLLLVPRRHIATWFDASAEERSALMAAVDQARALVAGQHRPDGFNVGINVGRAAGQTVFHLHVHLIPRYDGDMADPRGGVRHVIPGRGNYLLAPGNAGGPRLVSGGEEDPPLPYLGAELAQATRADIAVGFVMPSGVGRIEGHLRDFLGRGGCLRLLTGDYLDVTDPGALVRLLDLDGDRTLRVFETRRETGPVRPGPAPLLSFHPKAYLFRRHDGTGVAFVGSSNLSESALLTGIEWNYRTVSSAEGNAFDTVGQAFEALFRHPATTELTTDWLERYREQRRISLGTRPAAAIDVAPEPQQVPTPHAVQQEALAAIHATRQEGNTSGLVVLATGLGKTWLAAFDSTHPDYRRVLFVAHREEILNQSRDTFRRIRPDARLGFYKGGDRDADADGPPPRSRRSAAPPTWSDSPGTLSTPSWSTSSTTRPPAPTGASSTISGRSSCWA